MKGDKGSKKDDSIPKKISEKFENLRKSEFFHYATSNTRDAIVYILLILGLILLLFVPFWGGLIIGLIGGIYFSDEIYDFAKNINRWIDHMGIPRSIVLGAVLLTVLITTPALFIGAAIAIAVKKFMIPE